MSLRHAAGSLAAALALPAMLALTACTSVDRPTVQADEVALPTPLASYGASVVAARTQLEAAVSAVGSRLVVPAAHYRPSEPQALLLVPRVVLRADLADAQDGYVVLYAAGSPQAAHTLADEMARYLESGFGQTNFTPDTQFSVSTINDVVVFTSWSRGRSADPERAELVFDAVASVGQTVEVRK